MNQSRFSPLDPISRHSEILFGLLMVLTFTGCFNAFEAGKAEVKDLLIAGIGCNIAWGIIDAIVYLITTLAERGRLVRLEKKLRQLPEGDSAALEAMRDALPPFLAENCSDAELKSWQTRFKESHSVTMGRMLTWNDLRNCLGVFLLVFLSTFPVLLPFMFLDDTVLALRLSHAIALLMLVLLGRGLARYASSSRPWFIGFIFAAVGTVIVAITIALGG
ncbi:MULTISPECIES: VIT1/CCC1 transporter family protein [Buttiauxella]|jgi:VIT1/CCC1 family predicted Fe2+/Mn2+ transporter|uniref:VIT family protein n=1 Tax=Buttiauxella ferragutiae ATCC 51602 TaxID=1354252 RepID=A0ABX2W431_9ENTR|nr:MULTISPECIES: VIT1/CCC1 transporter family protein [Buttiauxella]AYN29899.1 hypothetical protein D8682_24735 [Buttiauxella sp. 3AFRM03]MCE0827197.1 VIT1/CCC1 transporter family protein [Buttiauxella ferragutiae]OAT25410.1 hypothetical protein M976_03754 [Buttiauxella ferragutiae ATCC 51602]TDN51092.1 VIT family protein [Buttiauxella sp. JUb87]UNK59717.1 VIT1/CCC1 transporter family protein [Buttiauxella ferragutiae]